MPRNGVAASEAQAQATILDLACALGWRHYHTHDSRRSPEGFPDLVLVRERVVFAELKKVGERPRPEQVDWLNALAAAGGEVYVWTIDDIAEVAAVLSRRERADG